MSLFDGESFRHMVRPARTFVQPKNRQRTRHLQRSLRSLLITIGIFFDSESLHTIPRSTYALVPRPLRQHIVADVAGDLNKRGEGFIYSTKQNQILHMIFERVCFDTSPRSPLNISTGYHTFKLGTQLQFFHSLRGLELYIKEVYSLPSPSFLFWWVSDLQRLGTH
jgi:hypothetical protein